MKEHKLSQADESAGAPLRRQPKPGQRILVVEDEPDIRRLNAEVLKNSGHEVDTAEDGKAGREALHAVRHAPESHALLIADHDMPGLSGLALVKKLRAARMALPVIMATGTLPTEDLFNRHPGSNPWLRWSSPMPRSSCWERCKPFCAWPAVSARRLRRHQTGHLLVACGYDDFSPRSGGQLRFLQSERLCGAGFIKLRHGVNTPWRPRIFSAHYYTMTPGVFWLL